MRKSLTLLLKITCFDQGLLLMGLIPSEWTVYGNAFSPEITESQHAWKSHERLRLQNSDPRNPDSEFQCFFMSVAILRSCPAWALSCPFKDHFSQYCHLMMWPSEPAGSYLLVLQAKPWFIREFANYHSPLTDYPHLLCIYLDAL